MRVRTKLNDKYLLHHFPETLLEPKPKLAAITTSARPSETATLVTPAPVLTNVVVVGGHSVPSSAGMVPIEDTIQLESTEPLSFIDQVVQETEQELLLEKRRLYVENVSKRLWMRSFFNLLISFFMA